MPLTVPIEVQALEGVGRSVRTAARLPQATVGDDIRPRDRFTRRVRKKGSHPLKAELRARNVVPIAPIRVLDTRDGSGAPGAVLGPLPAGSSVTVELTEPLGIPGHAVGVVGNLCVRDGGQHSDGFVSLYFNDGGNPTVNQVTMWLGPSEGVGGRVSLLLSDNHPGTAELLLDLVAYVS
jgi:hypothetical protein